MENRFLLILCLALFFLGGWLVPVTDPTENCYTLTAKEMLEAGDYFSPRIYGNFWYDKPIFFYWELILAYKIFGINDFAARFFPAVFATAGVFMTKFFAGRMFNKEIGFTAAVILAASIEYWYIAHAIITDMTLFCAIATTLFAFYFGFMERRRRLYYVAFAAAGVAVLTKGPIGFFLPALIILLFLIIEGALKELLSPQIWKGFAIFLAVVSIWYLPMYVIHGQAFLDEFLGVHNYLRATVSEHPQYDVWYYYPIVLLIGWTPWLFPILYGAGKFLWRERRLPALDARKRFLLIWAAAVFIVFQSFATKYPTYTFPYMMPLAILFAGYFIERRKLFWRMAAGTTAALIIFTFAAVPICEQNSGREEARVILPLVDENTCVVSYRRIYYGSLVFYSGLAVYRLETAEKISQLKPHKMSWTATNVMPFMSVDDLPADKKIIAVVDNDMVDKFFELTQGNWRLVEELPECKIFMTWRLRNE